jgi:hypothetical protein
MTFLDAKIKVQTDLSKVENVTRKLKFQKADEAVIEMSQLFL